MAAHCRVLRLFVLLIGLAGISPRGPRRGERAPIKFPEHAIRTGRLGRSRRLGQRRSRRGLCDLPDELPHARRPSIGSGRDATPSPVGDALKDVCGRAQAAIPLDDDGAQKFFEENFRPLRINKLGDTDGFLTGYYEPIIDGSRVPTGEFTAPLYRRPPNLVVAGWRKLGDAFPSQGRQGRPPRRPPQDRAVLRSRRDRGWRARRLAPGNLLAARSGRRAVRADPGLGADQAGRRHHPARQLRFA